MGSYLLVEDFKRGIDRRRTRLTSLPGSLYTLNNAHITRGGEIEKRKSFVSYSSTNLTNTFGLHSTGTALYTFGSVADPGLSGITYQRLQDGAANMTAVLFTANYAGKIYVIATFDNALTRHFYNGNLIGDWTTIADGTTTNILIAAEFVALINRSDNYTAANGGTATVTVTHNEVNQNFTSATKTVNQGSTDDQTITPATTQQPTAVLPKIKTFLIGGTPEAGDVFYIKLTDAETGTVELFAVRGGTGATGRTVLVKDGKLYSTASQYLRFSEIGGPKKWVSTRNGAGFIDMAQQDGFADALTALSPYGDNLAVFSRRCVQIWHTDPDPVLNRREQILKDTGTVAPKSVANFGDFDVFYLDDSGVRSVRARQATDSASVSDIGSPIDAVLAEDFPMVSQATARAASVSVFDPQDGRYWLAIGSTIYVYSYFPGTKIEAWSKYTASYDNSGTQTSFNVTDFAQLNGLVYARGNNNVVYVYGGTTGLTYDGCEVEVILPMLDAGKPANIKRAKAIDLTGEGDWNVYFGTDHTQPDAREGVAEPTDESTWNQQRIEVAGEGTHFNVKLTSDSTGRCVLGSLAIHYDLADAG